MSRRIDPRKFPDYTNRKVVDRHMGELDTHGVSRREFLAFASAAAVASMIESAHFTTSSSLSSRSRHAARSCRATSINPSSALTRPRPSALRI